MEALFRAVKIEARWRWAVSADRDLRQRLGAGQDRSSASAELALRRHGLTGEQLSKLASKAIRDYYDDRGGSGLAPERFADAAGFVREAGLRAIVEYDPERAGGVSATTWAYRRMRLRVTDWLRSDMGDARFGNAGRVTLSSDGEMTFAAEEEDSVEVAVELLTAGLSERSAWTLRHVASAVAEGATIVEVCERLMSDLADELGAAMPERLREGLVLGSSGGVDLFSEWMGEVAA